MREIMARLIIQTEGFGNRVVELALGINRVGRDEKYEIYIEHETISTLHCELRLTDDGVYVCDCNSTNGTFINGEPVMEAWLDAGQTLRLGKVELLVESTGVNLSIPKIERGNTKPPVVLGDGAVLCPRHTEHHATFKCTSCHEVMCNDCVRVMRIKGGRALFLCCLCHQKCERIASKQPKKKKGGLRKLLDTIQMKFAGRPKE